MTRASASYLVYVVAMVFFLLLVYQLSMLLPQIKVLFSTSLIVSTTFLSIFLGMKALRSKRTAVNNVALCVACMALILPFLSSLILWSVEFPNLLGSVYAPPLIIVILIVFSCFVVLSVPSIRDYLVGLTFSAGERYVKNVSSPERSATSDGNHMLLGVRLRFGRFAILAGLSVLGIPRGFPSSGSKLTQDVEGILSSNEDLGSYSTGFLTSLSKFKEQLVFEIQVSRKRVSLYFYVLATSRDLKNAMGEHRQPCRKSKER